MRIDFNRYPFDIFAQTDIKRYLTSFNINQGVNNIGSSVIGRLVYDNPYIGPAANAIRTARTHTIQRDFNKFMRAYADYMQCNPGHIKEELKGILFVVANMIREEQDRTASINPITDGPRLIYNIVRTFSFREGCELLEEEWEEKSCQQTRVLLISALSITLHCKKWIKPNTAEAQWIDDAVAVILSTLKCELTLDCLCKHEMSHVMPYHKGNIYNSYRCRDSLYQISKQRHNTDSEILSIVHKYGYVVSDRCFVWF